MWILLQAIDNRWLTAFDENTLAVTTSALMYRSIRFGVDEAHGGGTAVQWNWFREKGAVVPADGRPLPGRDAAGSARPSARSPTSC